jgi:hypothetical protein
MAQSLQASPVSSSSLRSSSSSSLRRTGRKRERSVTPEKHVQLLTTPSASYGLYIDEHAVTPQINTMITANPSNARLTRSRSRNQFDNNNSQSSAGVVTNAFPPLQDTSNNDSSAAAASGNTLSLPEPEKLNRELSNKRRWKNSNTSGANRGARHRGSRGGGNASARQQQGSSSASAATNTANGNANRTQRRVSRPSSTNGACCSVIVVT